MLAGRCTPLLRHNGAGVSMQRKDSNGSVRARCLGGIAAHGGLALRSLENRYAGYAGTAAPHLPFPNNCPAPYFSTQRLVDTGAQQRMAAVSATRTAHSAQAVPNAPPTTNG